MNSARLILIFAAFVANTFAQALIQQPGGALIIRQQIEPRPAPTNAPVARIFTEAALFKNGDALSGSLQGIRSNVVIWKHPDAAEPVELYAPMLSELQMRAESQTHSASTNACVIRLVNHDQIEAELLSMDATELNLKTWYAGEIKIPRSLVQSIMPTGPSRSTIFEGPTGIEDWTHGKTTQALPNQGNWIFRNGAFYASKSASIARDLHLPDVSNLSFDLTWKGYFQLAIALYSDSLQPVSLANKETEPDFGGFYSLQINTFVANLLPITKNDPIRYLGQASLLTLSQKNRAHIEIRTSKPRHSISLMVNGDLVREWIDPSEFAGRGTAVRFVHQGQGAVKIENIKVAEWDGLFEQPGSSPPPVKNDLAKLRNGDRVAGHVAAIKGGSISVALPDRKLEIPFTRAKEIQFAKETQAEAPNLPLDIRGSFVRGGFVTLQIEKWEPAGLIASSPIFGRATFHPRAFTRIEFLPARPPATN